MVERHEMTLESLQRDRDSRKRENCNDKPMIFFINRHDILAWIGGISFVCLMAMAIMLAGQAAHWDASSPYKHYNTSSIDRFTPEPLYCNDTKVKGRHGERCYGRWYYWKLPVHEVTPLTRVVVWLCYSCHQILQWSTIYLAQRDKEELQNAGRESRFGHKLTKYNVILLIANSVFFLIHLGETHWTYDGLAQDVGLASSEGAVIMILALILVLEYNTRGVAFMCPNNRWNERLRVNMTPMSLVRKYHGYLICWAITYTFWYHPMENTVGHVLGFIHGGMLLLQGSLIYTKVHLNRYWRLLIECWVIGHGTFIAYQTHNPDTFRQQWPMYLLGFGFMFSVTQVYGLPFWRNIHSAFRAIPLIIFLIVSVLLCRFGVIRGDTPTQSNYSKLKEMFYIPLELYGLMILLWLFLFLWIKVERALNKSRGNQHLIITENTTSNFISENVQSEQKTSRDTIFEKKKSFLKQALGIAGFLLVHAMMITVSFYLQWIDLSIPNTNIMFMLVGVFSFCWSIAIMMLQLALTSAVD